MYDKFVATLFTYLQNCAKNKNVQNIPRRDVLDVDVQIRNFGAGNLISHRVVKSEVFNCEFAKLNYNGLSIINMGCNCVNNVVDVGRDLPV
jgi:hypothetical protein